MESKPGTHVHRITSVMVGDLVGPAGRTRNVAPVGVVVHPIGVEARNADGEWNQNPARMSIELLPLWWETWWARLGVLGMLLLSVWSYIRSEERRGWKKKKT